MIFNDITRLYERWIKLSTIHIIILYGFYPLDQDVSGG